MLVLSLSSKAKNGITVKRDWYYNGNVMLRKGFLNKWFTYTGVCLHVLGFRFTLHVH